MDPCCSVSSVIERARFSFRTSRRFSRTTETTLPEHRNRISSWYYTTILMHYPIHSYHDVFLDSIEVREPFFVSWTPGTLDFVS